MSVPGGWRTPLIIHLRRFLHDPDALLASHVRPGMTVADIGCGMGYFSLALARLVGEKGQVLSVDLQQEMLDRVRTRALKQGLAGTIRTVLAGKNDITITGPVDFILTFWMVHEVARHPAASSGSFRRSFPTRAGC